MVDTGMKTLVKSNQQKKWKSVTTLMSGSQLASSDSSRWSRKESTGQFKWKMTHSQEAKLQVLLDPAANCSGQFTIWVLASPMAYFRKVDRYKIIKQSNPTESVSEMNLIHTDSKLPFPIWPRNKQKTGNKLLWLCSGEFFSYWLVHSQRLLHGTAFK